MKLAYKISLLRLVACSVLIQSALQSDSFAQSWVGKNAVDHEYREVLKATENSLEMMRDPESSLMWDKVLWKNDSTKPEMVKKLFSSNQALDLLRLLEKTDTESVRKVDQILRSLHSLEKAKIGDAEYFYWIYEPDSKGKLQRGTTEVSSLDNFHLAFALWVASEKAQNIERPDDDKSPTTRELAKQMFAKMPLDPFLEKNRDTGLILGAFQRSPDGGHVPGTFAYGNWGSESRSMYTLGMALGMIKASSDPGYFDKVLANTAVNCSQGVMQTWDGGIFQYMLPELLFSESHYSPETERTQQHVAKVILEEKEKRNLPIAPGLSASQFAVMDDPAFKGAPGDYRGQLGLLRLMAAPVEGDPAAHENVMTPHAVFLAAMKNPAVYEKEIKALKSFGGKNGALYRQDYGFLDAHHLGGQFKGLNVPAQLSLDQGMIAHSIEQMLSKDRHTFSGRVVAEHPEVSKRLREAYVKVDNFIKKACAAKLREERSADKAH